MNSEPSIAAYVTAWAHDGDDTEIKSRRELLARARRAAGGLPAQQDGVLTSTLPAAHLAQIEAAKRAEGSVRPDAALSRQAFSKHNKSACAPRALISRARHSNHVDSTRAREIASRPHEKRSHGRAPTADRSRRLSQARNPTP